MKLPIACMLYWSFVPWSSRDKLFLQQINPKMTQFTKATKLSQIINKYIVPLEYE